MLLALRIPSAFLALALLLEIAATPQTQNKNVESSPAQHAMGTRLTVSGIPNFGQVSENLYRGALPNTTGLEALKKMGINIVIDMRRGHDSNEENRVKQLGMDYVSIPSRCPYPQDGPIALFLQVVEKNPGKKIFVHCRLGDDRTGIAVASYRIAEQGWSVDEARKEMQAFGFSRLHNFICPGLLGYEEKLPQLLKNNPAFQQLPSHTAQASK
jgi:tyrosine-protein phosphatase SIW14